MNPQSGSSSLQAQASVPLELKLDYQHAHGWLASYLERLRDGEAWATRCPSCNRSWCPPHRRCPRDGAVMDWHRIDGVGTLLQATAHEGALPFQTRSQRLTFGLVRLDGTENAMLARLGFGLDVATVGLRVRLARAPEPVAHPAQAAWFTTELDVK